MSKKGGILALLGLAAGAFAFWKYNNLPPEKKDELKARVNDAGRKLKNKVDDVENTISEKYDQYKNKANQDINDVTG